MSLLAHIVVGVVLGNMAFFAMLVARASYELRYEKPEVDPVADDKEWYGL